MPLWFRVARIWLPITLAATAVIGFAYLGVQQGYRNGLDDPQLQLATDAALALNAGATPASVVPSRAVDAAASLSPFVAVLGADDALIASNATVVTTGNPPRGVLAAARAKGTNRVTWQPYPGLRIASVEVAAKDGRVVVAGRNMRAVEARIDDLTRIAAIAWAVTVAAVLVLVALVEWWGLRFSAGDAEDA